MVRSPTPVKVRIFAVHGVCVECFIFVRSPGPNGGPTPDPPPPSGNGPSPESLVSVSSDDFKVTVVKPLTGLNGVRQRAKWGTRAI